MSEYTIYTYSIVRSAIENFTDKCPYCAAILEGPDGNRFPVLLDGYQDGMNVTIGQTVKRIESDSEHSENYIYKL